MNLFATVLTYPAPSANYRGESELNRTVIQKVTDGRFDYPIFSPESMRNALREMLAGYDGLLCNRKRIHPVSGKGKSGEGEGGDKQQLAVQYAKYPDPNEYIDDFFFGYLLAVKGKELDKLRKEKGDKYPLKRDSVLRMNLAKGLESYRHNSVFTQSPKFAEGNPWTPGGGDVAAKSGLLHRETCVTAFQYPFALSGNDCLYVDPSLPAEKRKEHPKGREWTRKLLQAIGELNRVAGNHARSYFEMAPASIVVRLTNLLVAGYSTYGFKVQRDPRNDQEHIHLFPELIDGICRQEVERNEAGEIIFADPEKKTPKLKPVPDYPGKEFFIGGKIVRDMSDGQLEALRKQGGTLERDPRKLLETVASKFVGGA
jgi:CRISPR-associated protein Cst2